MDNIKPAFDQLCDPEYRRSQMIHDKDGAVFVIFNELKGLINKTQLAEQYFNRTQSWLSQKLHGATVCHKERAFTEAEYAQLARAFRDIATRLNTYADEIDAAQL